MYSNDIHLKFFVFVLCTLDEEKVQNEMSKLMKINRLKTKEKVAQPYFVLLF